MGDIVDSLEAQIARLSLEAVLDPPNADDPVVQHASPEQLVEEFASTVGIGFADEEPAHPEADLLAAAELVVRRSVRTNHPRFMNQNFAGADPTAVVGDWLGAALNTTGATFEAAPVFTLMEQAVLRKLAGLVGYPLSDTGISVPGLFCPGGSTATLYALQLARHRRDPEVVRRGASAERLVLFVSDAGHYAATKSAALLGIGADAVTKVATDADGAMSPTALAEAVDRAWTRGDTPFAVIATAGTTVTAAFDDCAALADVCEAHDVWLHVDGCYGGSALFSPAQAHRLRGAERSDSFVWNLHKMMGMTQQCTALLVRDPVQLEPCFAAGADYLFQPDKLYGDYDSGDRTFQCARRIDVLKLWLCWKKHGDAGFGRRIDHAVNMADHTRALIERSGGAFAPVVAGTFTNVVFVWVPPEMRPLDLATLASTDHERLHRLAPRIKARMQAEGTAMVGFQPVHGINAFRLLFMNPAVQPSDVEAVLGLIAAYGEQEWADAAGAGLEARPSLGHTVCPPTTRGGAVW